MAVGLQYVVCTCRYMSGRLLSDWRLFGR